MTTETFEKSQSYKAVKVVQALREEQQRLINDGRHGGAVKAIDEYIALAPMESHSLLFDILTDHNRH